MGQLAVVAMLAGTAMQAVAADKEAQATADAAKYNARIAMEQASAEVERQTTMARRLRELNRTRIAKSNVTETGSSLLVLTSNQRDADKQAYNIMRAANATAGLYRMQARSVKEIAKYEIAGTVLSGVGRAAGMYSGGDTTGWSLFGNQGGGFVGSGSGRYNW